MSIGTGEIGEERHSATSSASSSAAQGPHRATNDDRRAAVAAVAVAAVAVAVAVLLSEAGRCVISTAAERDALGSLGEAGDDARCDGVRAKFWRGGGRNGRHDGSTF